MMKQCFLPPPLFIQTAKMVQGALKKAESLITANTVVDADAPAESATDILVLHEALDSDRDCGRICTHQLLQLLTLSQQTDKCARIGAGIHFVLSFELDTEMSRQSSVKVTTSKVRITGSCKNLKMNEEYIKY